MTRKQWWIAAAVAAVLAIGVGSAMGWVVYRVVVRTLEHTLEIKKPPEVEVVEAPHYPRHRYWSAEKIAAYFEQNAVKAELEFKDVRMPITGKVERIDTELLGRPYLLLESKRYSIQCLFPRGSESTLAAVRKGDTVFIAGTFDGSLGNAVLFDECVFSPPVE